MGSYHNAPISVDVMQSSSICDSIDRDSDNERYSYYLNIDFKEFMHYCSMYLKFWISILEGVI